VNGDSPSKRRLFFDDPFRIVGYVGEPAHETGVLLWSGIDPNRYFKRSPQSEVDSFEHLLTLDYAGQVVAWQSMQSDAQGRRWLEVPWESIENLNRHIRDVEPLRYRQAQPPASPKS
jgi:hypothetical protein